MTALLDVVLILFFAAIINISSQVDVMQDQKTEALRGLEDAQIQATQLSEELAEAYGVNVDELSDYKEVYDRISKIAIQLVGNTNEVWINGQSTQINIIRERLEPLERERLLKKELETALKLAIEKREKSDILFIRISVNDRDVYKYAYDYLLDLLDEVIVQYGKDKVMLSREFY